MKKSTTYVRDKRSPEPKSENVSKAMSANKSKHTSPEMALRKALWSAEIKGYRNNYTKVPGKPDIAFPRWKIAIFVNGCFWHRCPKCNYSLPKNNADFWKDKFSKNVARDHKKTEALISLGWKVLTVWECELKKDINKIVTTIENTMVRF